MHIGAQRSDTFYRGVTSIYDLSLKNVYLLLFYRPLCSELATHRIRSIICKRLIGIDLNKLQPMKHRNSFLIVGIFTMSFNVTILEGAPKT